MAFIRLEPGDLELIRKAFATTFTVVSLNQFVTAKYRNIADQVGWFRIASASMPWSLRSSTKPITAACSIASSSMRPENMAIARTCARSFFVCHAGLAGASAAARTVSMSRRRSAHWRDSPHQASRSFPRVTWRTG